MGASYSDVVRRGVLGSGLLRSLNRMRGLSLESFIRNILVGPSSSFQLGRVDAMVVDFFDGKHNVVLGSSWATHPRIAGRKSL
jgi:hypothetical protein